MATTSCIGAAVRLITPCRRVGDWCALLDPSGQHGTDAQLREEPRHSSPKLVGMDGGAQHGETWCQPRLRYRAGLDGIGEEQERKRGHPFSQLVERGRSPHQAMVQCHDEKVTRVEPNRWRRKGLGILQDAMAVAAEGRNDHRSHGRIHVGNDDPLPIEDIRVARVARAADLWGRNVESFGPAGTAGRARRERQASKEIYTAGAGIDTGAVVLAFAPPYEVLPTKTKSGPRSCW